MSGKKILLIPDQHAHSDYNNDRATWLSKLIIDVNPDIVLNGGDCADMPSLGSYDKGKRSFHGRSYKKDIEAHLDFQDKLWSPIKSRKKKLPYRVVLEGNHEHRIERALDLSPELSETIGFNDYDFNSYYNEVVRYDGGTPGIWKTDDIIFSHFFITGVSGKPIGGEYPAHTLLSKNNESSIAFHSHTLDFATKRTVGGRTLNALVCGCYQDYINDWSGSIGQLWRPGIAILDNVENGDFDFQWISLKSIKDEYS